MSDPKNILIFGSSGGCGLWTTNQLLNTNHNLTVVVRNENKLKQILGPKFEKLTKVIPMDIDTVTSSYQKDQSVNPITDIINSSNTHILINAIGSTPGVSEEICRNINQTLTMMLTDAAKQTNLSKFILISSMCVERPYSMVSFILNSVANNILGYKIDAENYLRNSGVNQVIIRPGGLGAQNNDISKEPKAEQIVWGQGDKLQGGNMIHRATVGRIISEDLINDDILTNFTFEVITDGNKNVKQENIVPIDQSKMVQDKGMIECYLSDHKSAKLNIQIIMTIILISIIVLVVVIIFIFI